MSTCSQYVQEEINRAEWKFVELAVDLALKGYCAKIEYEKGLPVLVVRDCGHMILKMRAPVGKVSCK